MGVIYSEIIERMRWAGKLKNDSAVARVLGVTPQALSNYKKRGEMPTDLVLKFANIYGLSVDWLITGDGEMYKAGKAASSEAGGYATAAEHGSPYGKEARTSLQGVVDSAGMSADEIIYVGKLLKLLRGANKNTAAAIKYSVDAFLKTAEQDVDAPVDPTALQPLPSQSN